MAEKIATRQAYGEELAALGAKNENIVVLDADLSGSTMTKMFKAAYPERFFNAGIAEQNMYAMAAGLATSGKIPFASTFAMFAAGRAYEIIRNSIGYPHANVKICATHAGITVGEDGATHQCVEDLALMRAIPGMTVINPADATSAKILLNKAAELYGPVYMRFGRAGVPVRYAADADLQIGKAVQLKDGHEATIIATGIMVEEALAAAEALEKEGILVRVLDMHTIKPLDEEAILAAAQETGAIVTAEEHTVKGGLGSAVAEVVSTGGSVGAPCPVPMAMVGVQDVFGRSGKPAELMAEYKLTAKDIEEAVNKVVVLK